MMVFLLLEVWAYPIDLNKTIELRVEDPRATSPLLCHVHWRA